MNQIDKELKKLDQKLAKMTQSQRLRYLRNLGFDVVSLGGKKSVRVVSMVGSKNNSVAMAFNIPKRNMKLQAIRPNKSKYVIQKVENEN